VFTLEVATPVAAGKANFTSRPPASGLYEKTWPVWVDWLISTYSVASEEGRGDENGNGRGANCENALTEAINMAMTKLTRNVFMGIWIGLSGV
jgi:hypothetical protein